MCDCEKVKAQSAIPILEIPFPTPVRERAYDIVTDKYRTAERSSFMVFHRSKDSDRPMNVEWTYDLPDGSYLIGIYRLDFLSK